MKRSRVSFRRSRIELDPRANDKKRERWRTLHVRRKGIPHMRAARSA